MKKKLFFLMVFFTGYISAHAQLPQEGETKQQERLQSLYVAFITQKLELTGEEAQAFWPIHNEFSKEIKNVDINLPELEREQKILDIKKRFEPRFTKVLRDPKRVNRFFGLHGEWRRKLVERIKNRPNQQRPRLGNKRGQL
jgi:hypothetical protein